ncbi:MAG: DUF2793 domain-containing protein [Paracoccaceae bacterium]|nr:DUF2793 domain-containing protein [Paracoccaceae bacterium]
MPDTSARLGLPFLLPSQAQKHVTHNEALQQLDALTQLALEGRGAETPPAAPAEGEIHALGPAPLDAWAGQAGMLAQWVSPAWLFLAPQDGWRAWDKATATLCSYQGGDWQEVIPTLQNVEGVGIGTTSDATNPLSLSGDAALFSHAGAGHQLKVNKAAAGETASLLYQSDWTGHAEMGLAGDNDFHLKVSADGSAWTEALTVAASTGLLSGAAVQSDATDETEGRLLTVGAFGLGADDTPRINDFTEELRPGFYHYLEAAVIGGPGGASYFGMAMVARVNNMFSVIAMRATQNTSARRIWLGTRTTLTGAIVWTEIYTQTRTVGTVSQSAGVPTGAVIERGGNANGNYVRWADGTQICTNNNAAITTAPAAFSGTVTKIDGDKLWIGRWY